MGYINQCPIIRDPSTQGSRLGWYIYIYIELYHEDGRAAWRFFLFARSRRRFSDLYVIYWPILSSRGAWYTYYIVINYYSIICVITHHWDLRIISRICELLNQCHLFKAYRELLGHPVFIPLIVFIKTIRLKTHQAAHTSPHVLYYQMSFRHKCVVCSAPPFGPYSCQSAMHDAL